MKTIFLYVTTKNRAEARKIGAALVREKLAACANIVPLVESVYMWKGQLENSKEAALWLKTTPSLRSRAKKRIQKLHSYKVPCIVEIPAASLNAAYSRWLKNALS